MYLVEVGSRRVGAASRRYKMFQRHHWMTLVFVYALIQSFLHLTNKHKTDLTGSQENILSNREAGSVRDLREPVGCC